MLEDVHEKVNSKFDKEWELKIENFAQEQAEWARSLLLINGNGKLSYCHDRRTHAARANKVLKHNKREFERNRLEFELRMGALKESNRLWEEKMKEQLIKDGYLGKDEKLESMHWHNGKLEINGKKIKPEDQKKYNEIHDKYFGLEKC